MINLTTTLNGNVICPICHGENPPDEMFCGNEGCHKALGEFRYVEEEFQCQRKPLERIADKVSSFTSHPHFVTVHIVWFAIWIALNSGFMAYAANFDRYPFGLLGLLLGIEATFITGFLLISQNRQARYAEMRAALDYEVNVRSYRKLAELTSIVEHLNERVATLDRDRT